jgi:hypothetical protein
MSEFEQDPSASTGRFRAFVERGDDDTLRARRSPVSPPMMIAGAVVVVIAVIVAIVIAVA